MLEVWFQVSSKTLLLVVFKSFYFLYLWGIFDAGGKTFGHVEHMKNEKKFHRKSSQTQYQLQMSAAWGLIWRCHIWWRFLWFHIKSRSRYLKVFDTCSSLLLLLLIASYQILVERYNYFFCAKYFWRCQIEPRAAPRAIRNLPSEQSVVPVAEKYQWVGILLRFCP